MWPVSVWGWGDDEASARRGAADRLHRVLERLGRGERFPERYAYGNRPLREEILRVIEGDSGNGPAAIITRNRYGADVLNTARMLFLDIDAPEAGVTGRLGRLFGGASPAEKTLSALRDALRQYGLATFRIYRTASGYRVLAVNREFNPTAPDTHELMRRTATDPAFAQLCLAQRSFRARLTPKPWRSRVRTPPGEHPRQDEGVRRAFEAWLDEYQARTAGFATCRYLETVGNGSATGDARILQDLHDRATRSDENLPLA
jgi:hypothetical protein